MKVIITDYIIDPYIERQVFGDSVEIICLNTYNEKQISDEICDADVLMVWHVEITRYTIDRLKKCKAILRIGTGYDNVDWVYARNRGIDVTNVPDYGTEEVADTACSMILSLTRGINRYNEEARQYNRGWQENFTADLQRLSSHNLGIIGLGRIGTATSIRMKAFNMNVGFFDPYLQDGVDKSLGLKRFNTLDEIIEWASVLSIHTPLTIETQSMIDDKFISNCNDNMILINTARGGIVKSLSILHQGLLSGKIGGLGLDVLPEEPPNHDDELISNWIKRNAEISPKIIITPHTAFYSQESWEEMRVKAARNAANIQNGEPLINVIN